MASWDFGNDGSQSVNSQGSGQSVIGVLPRGLEEKSRRNRCNAANVYLQYSLADFGFIAGPHENVHGTDRSEDVLEPELAAGALIRVVGIMVASKISRTVVDLTRQISKGPFVSADSPGGGSVADVTGFLAACLEAMNLSDKDIGCILIDAYHFLQEDDLPLSSQTWRALLVTCLQATADTVLADSKQQMAAIAALQSHAAHWWTLTQASKAHKVFIQRESFKQLSSSQRADLYFELRQVALGMCDSESTASTTGTLTDKDPSLRKSSGSFQDPRQLPGVRKCLDENSLDMSESVIESGKRSSIISL